MKPIIKALFDFNLFQYRCIKINKGQEIFTYKTDENTAKQINQEIIDTFKRLSQSPNIIKDIFQGKNKHQIKELDKRNLILEIFKSFGFKDEYVDQYIGDSTIYQFPTKSKRRLFFIAKPKEISKQEKIMIIKPLFLDVNHVIYNDEHFQKNFHTCAVCLKQECLSSML